MNLRGKLIAFEWLDPTTALVEVEDEETGKSMKYRLTGVKVVPENPAAPLVVEMNVKMFPTGTGKESNE